MSSTSYLYHTLSLPPSHLYHYSNSHFTPFHLQLTTLSRTPLCNPNLILISSSNKAHQFLLPAKKKNLESDPFLDSSVLEQKDNEFEEFDEDGDDEEFDEDEDFEDDYLEEDAEPSFGDGEGGGGISLVGTTWDKDVLRIAEEVASSFNGELGIYAFKTFLHSAIRVRIERLSNKSGSPNMEDIEAFAKAYRDRLREAEADGTIPVHLSFEVSSPGLERVVRIPEDLERFKDRSMYVRYTTIADDSTPSCEQDGILRLESFDLDAKCCTWGLADVKVNREKAGKGRPLNKKQREWRITTPFDSLLLVRIYADF